MQKKLNKNYIYSVLVPTFHEEKNIKDFYKAFQRINNKSKKFFLFVDDSKNNLTALKINKYFIETDYKILKFKKDKKISTRCKSSWKGFIWLTKNINCDYVVEMDIDLAQHPKDLNRGLNYLSKKKGDVLIFSKYLKNSKNEGRTILRKTISYLYSKICRTLFSARITDYSNSYRIYKTESLKDLLKTKRNFDSPIQHLDNILFFIKRGYSIYETYCHYVERKGADSNIKFRHLYAYFIDFVSCIKKNL